MVTALPDDEVKEILYHTMPYLQRKKITKQGYNCLERSIQEMPGFLETRVENLETPAPPSAVRSLPKKKKKKNTSKKRKATSFEDSDNDSSDNEKKTSKKKFFQYY